MGTMSKRPENIVHNFDISRESLDMEENQVWVVLLPSFSQGFPKLEFEIRHEGLGTPTGNTPEVLEFDQMHDELRGISGAICNFLRREDELMTELMNHKRSTSY
jgi:hypothetical protein